MNPKRILLAESNPLYRQAISEVLEKIKGFKLIEKVGTGWEAVRLSAQLKPDVILMDFNLPGLNGLEAARSIKQRLTHVAVIILLYEEAEEYKKAVEQSEAWGYLLKQRITKDLPSLLEKLPPNQKEGDKGVGD